MRYTSTMAESDIADMLVNHGMLFRAPEGFIAAGIQWDANVVFLKLANGQVIEASSCDHNCTDLVGGYNCEAALSYNRGVKSKFASVDWIFERACMAREGIYTALVEYVEQDLDRYCETNFIPDSVREVVKRAMLAKLIEFNLFGGNPEMHPDALKLISMLRKAGFRVNFTTTGRRIMVSETFRGMLHDPQYQPHLIALSADDIERSRLPELNGLDLPETRKRWDAVPKDHGQEHKFYEAVWALKYAIEHEGTGKAYPPILFNMVLHQGNIEHALEIIEALQQLSKTVIINPYVAQTSFQKKPAPFGPTHLGVYVHLVNHFIAQARDGHRQYTRRLHYWLSHRAILQAWVAGTLTWQQAAAMIAGYGSWHCGRSNNPGYLQVGRGNPDVVRFGEMPKENPGGYMGSFWNSRTVTDVTPIQSPEHVHRYLRGRRHQLMLEAGPGGCDGCAMPRLEFTFPAMEENMEFHKPMFGMARNPTIPLYHQARMAEVGF